FEHGVIPPSDWHSFVSSATTILEYIWVKFSGLGFHAVGVFIILSGWALMQSTASRAATGPVSWAAWSRARFLRLYPMYWVAHLVYSTSTLVALLGPIDSRIVLILFRLRFVNLSRYFGYRH